MYPSSKIFNSVKVASTHVVQNYCEALMEANGLNNAEGKKMIYGVAKSYSKTQYESSYIGIVRKMEALGFEKFSFRDLDLTALKSILLYNGPQLGFELPNNVWLSLSALARYKNDDSHDSTNQPLEEALKWADKVIAQISCFIDYAEQDNGIPDYDRQLFSQTSRSELDKLPSEIRSFHDERFCERLRAEKSMKRDIDEAVAAGDLEESVPFIIEKWNRKLQGSPLLSLTARTYLDELLFENGVYHDTATLAERYFDYEDIRDFDKALRFFELSDASSLSAKATIKYASIHLNGLAEKSSAEEGKKLLEKFCEKDGSAACVADAYYHGRGLRQDFNKALLYYNRTNIDKLMPFHLIQMASIHLNGWADASCPDTGNELLAKCAMSKPGLKELGSAFFLGRSLKKNYALAAAYYEKHSPYPPTLEVALRLASIYINGLSENASTKKGLRLLEDCKRYEGIVIWGTQITIIEYVTDEGFHFYKTNTPDFAIEKPPQNNQPKSQSKRQKSTKKRGLLLDLFFGR